MLAHVLTSFWRLRVCDRFFQLTWSFDLWPCIPRSDGDLYGLWSSSIFPNLLWAWYRLRWRWVGSSCPHGCLSVCSRTTWECCSLKNKDSERITMRLTSGLGEDVVDLFDFWLIELTGSLAEVNLGDLEDEVGESSADTLDSAKGEHDLTFSFDVCVLDSENVSEFLTLDQMERLCLNNESRNRVRLLSITRNGQAWKRHTHAYNFYYLPLLFVTLRSFIK